MRKVFTLIKVIEVIVAAAFVVVVVSFFVFLLGSYGRRQRQIEYMAKSQEVTSVTLRSDHTQTIEKVGYVHLEKYLADLTERRIVSIAPLYSYPTDMGRPIIALHYIVVSEPLETTPER